MGRRLGPGRPSQPSRGWGLLQFLLYVWTAADPGLPEVEDARNRLVGLKGS
jgi:hypothetical protein